MKDTGKVCMLPTREDLRPNRVRAVPVDFLSKNVKIGKADSSDVVEAALVAPKAKNRSKQLNPATTPWNDHRARRLTDRETIILHATPQEMIEQFVPRRWVDYCKAKRKVFYCTDRSFQLRWDEEKQVDHESDDSDEFDEDNDQDSETDNASYKNDQRRCVEILQARMKDMASRIKDVDFKEELPLFQLKMPDIVTNDSDDFADSKSAASEALPHLNTLLSKPLLSGVNSGKIVEIVKELRMTLVESLSTVFDIVSPGKRQPRQQHGYQKHDLSSTLSKKLGIRTFRPLQRELCEAILSDREGATNTIVALFPTGYGKSLSFVLPTVVTGGLTLVIEPLRALIDNQMDNIKKYSGMVKVEKLMSFDDVRKSYADKDFSCTMDTSGHDMENTDHPAQARERLDQLCEEAKDREAAVSDDNSPVKHPGHIIFVTPELIQNYSDRIIDLAKLGCLRRIVFDEFDVKQECSKSFRPAYDEVFRFLLEKRDYAQVHHSSAGRSPTDRITDVNPFARVKFLFLSATTDKKALLELPPLHETNTLAKPRLFVAERPLPESLSFRVERKVHLNQVAQRIQHYVKNYTASSAGARSDAPKCLCYCLSDQKCQNMKKELLGLGLKAEAVSSKTNDRDNILKRFRDGKVTVLCTTTVLGRGFHVPDIRFVFHAHLPTSLPNYIQEAGRGGRDGEKCECVLFYRPHDESAVENVRSPARRHNPPGGLCNEETAKINAITKKNHQFLKVLLSDCIDQCNH